MADKENLTPEDVLYVAVPLKAIRALDETQRRCRREWSDAQGSERNARRAWAIDDFLDVHEVKTALGVGA